MRLRFVENIRTTVEIPCGTQDHRMFFAVELVDKVRPPGEPAAGVVVSATRPVVAPRVAMVHQPYRLVILLAPHRALRNRYGRYQRDDGGCSNLFVHTKRSPLGYPGLVEQLLMKDNTPPQQRQDAPEGAPPLPGCDGHSRGQNKRLCL